MRLKALHSASPGATRKWLIRHFMGNIGGGIEWQIREFARLQDAKSPENETSRPHFRNRAKIL